MELASGTRIGPYEIISVVGVGGMGEVYRARDTRLGREVAVKFLLPAVAADAVGLARFDREAQVLASLNHPNIAQIYGLEDAAGTRALVMELIEGPTLAERIAQGPIPVHEALPIAAQIAEALEAAHEIGIVHRDLKPANIKLSANGTVKVLDFGLAKVVERTPASGAEMSISPTMQVLTHDGTILGTVAYMSPEQAEGKPVDRRSDLWAFGVVLLEMLTGRRAFSGGSLAQVLASVLRAEPDWSLLPADTPASIRTLLRRCLQKERGRRLSSAADARLEIEEALVAPSSESSAASTARPPVVWRRALALAAAAIVLLVAAAGGWAVWRSSTAPAKPLMRFAVVPSPAEPLMLTGADRDIALSPDGSRLVYAAGPRRQLMIRSTDQIDAVPVAGVTNAHSPFVSLDGRWIGFFTGISGEIEKVSISGGLPISICRITGAPRGASWAEDDTIVFATNEPTTGLFRVSASGGKPTMISTPDSGHPMEADHLFPSVLPGGKAVLFTVGSSSTGSESAAVEVLDLRSGRRKSLIRGASEPLFVDGGYIVYASGGSLRAMRFDPAKLEVSGDPVLLLDRLMTSPTGAASFSISHNGTLAYVPPAAAVPEATGNSLVWVSHEGKEEPTNAPAHRYNAPHISPDGKRLTVAIDEEERDVWTWDFARHDLTRLTFDPRRDWYPAWSSDGQRVFFISARSGVPHVFRRMADGTGGDEQMTDGRNVQFGSPSSSPDGRSVVFTEVIPATSEDIMLLSLDGSRHVQPLLQSEFAERNPAISPDGRWIAYESNESGQEQIYVRPFPNVADGRWQVSVAGGTTPVWARSGTALFYRDLSSVMSSPVRTTPTFSAGTPTKLFDGPYLVTLGASFDVSPDGQRFLMIKENAGTDRAAVSSSIVLVINWFEELKSKAGSRR